MDIYTSKFSQEKKFYVYQYLRSTKSENGEIGTPYYIGKGFGNRKSHSRHAGISIPKDEKKIRLASESMNEADSFQLEILLIHLYGRLDLKTGILHNRTNGGDGATGAVRSAQTIQKRLRTVKALGIKYSSPISVAKGLATKKRNGTLNTITPGSVAKALETKRKHGTVNSNTKESRRKSIETRRRKGTLKRTAASIAKGLETKRRNNLIRQAVPSPNLHQQS